MASISPADDRSLESVDALAVAHAARTGQRSALAELYALHSGPLLRYLRAVVGSEGDTYAARTWLSAARRLDVMPLAPARFRFALLQTARELVEVERQPSIWRSAHPTTRLPRRPHIAVDESADVASANTAGQAAAGRIVDSLSETDADVVLLAAACGCSREEIAELLGLSVRDIDRISSEASELLAQAFGTAGAERLLDRLNDVVAAPPPAGLLEAMTQAVRGEEDTSLGVSKSVAVKAAVVAAFVFGTATAAAASGTLPAPAQNSISGLMGHVGVEFPTHDEVPTSPDSAPADAGGTGSEQRPETHGTDVSDVARTTEAEGADKGAEISTTARGDHGPAGTENKGNGSAPEAPGADAPGAQKQSTDQGPPAPAAPDGGNRGGGKPSK